VDLKYKMLKIEDDLRYLESGLGILEDYLLSDDMFWKLGGRSAWSGTALPMLSLGGLLLARASLRGRALAGEDRARFERLDHQLEDVRSRWRVAWGTKCGKSFSVRLRMWSDFMSELREQSEEHATRYAYEVRWRVMLHLLKPESPSIEPAELDLLKMLDLILRKHLVGDEFIWDPALAGGFPADEYWFLYGRFSA
jgi:hypothetical protein